MIFVANRLTLCALLFCFAGSFCPTAFAVDGDLYLLGIAVDVLTMPGSWRDLGRPGSWRGTIAGTTLDSQLYTVEAKGGLFVTDPLTGQRQQLGVPAFGETRFLFAANAKLYTIENDGGLYAIDPSTWSRSRVGEDTAWQEALAGAVLDDQLYTIERNGGLFVTDLVTGQRRQIGRPDFGSTVLLLAGNKSLYSIDADGSLYRIAHDQATLARIGPSQLWSGARAGIILDEQLYTVEKDGGFYATDLADGQRRRLGNWEFAGTTFMFAAAGQLNTIESDGSLHRLAVVAPEIDTYAWCVDEVEKAFREQGSDFYKMLRLRTVLGRQATNPAIAESLDWLTRSATDKDFVVVYISGHGAVHRTHGWGFATADRKMFWGQQVKEELAKLPCQGLIIIETCYSGGFALALGDDLPVPSNLTVICSCKANQRSKNHLSVALGEALYGRADTNHDGVVDLDEVLDYVPRRYWEWLPKTASANARQSPVIVKAQTRRGHRPLTKSAPNLAAIVDHGFIWSALLQGQEGDRFRVHPLGWSARPTEPYFLTNEVPRDSICLPSDGTPLLVEQKGQWYPARLLGREGQTYRIHYLGWNEDEDVHAKRVRYPFVGRPSPMKP